MIILASAIKIIPEYERAVLFRLGRLMNARGPGLIFIIPVIDRIIRVSLRVIVFDIPPQEVITRDNVTCKINAVLFYRVVEAEKAVVNVENFHEATNQLARPRSAVLRDGRVGRNPFPAGKVECQDSKNR